MEHALYSLSLSLCFFFFLILFWLAYTFNIQKEEKAEGGLSYSLCDVESNDYTTQLTLAGILKNLHPTGANGLSQG